MPGAAAGAGGAHGCAGEGDGLGPGAHRAGVRARQGLVRRRGFAAVPGRRRPRPRWRRQEAGGGDGVARLLQRQELRVRGAARVRRGGLARAPRAGARVHGRRCHPRRQLRRRRGRRHVHARPVRARRGIPRLGGILHDEPGQQQRRWSWRRWAWRARAQRLPPQSLIGRAWRWHTCCVDHAASLFLPFCACQVVKMD